MNICRPCFLGLEGLPRTGPSSVGYTQGDFNRLTLNLDLGLVSVVLGTSSNDIRWDKGTGVNQRLPIRARALPCFEGLGSNLPILLALDDQDANRRIRSGNICVSGRRGVQAWI